MKPLKIGFILLSNSRRPIPSTRITVLNMFPFLRAAWCDPHIVYEPENADETPEVAHLATHLITEKFDLVYFQKVYGPQAVALARTLAGAGIKTVYGVCDFVNVSMAEATDATIVVTDFLKSLYPPAVQNKIHVVHDGIERPDVRKTFWNDHLATADRPLRAVLVTSAELDQLPVIGPPPDWLEITIVGRYAPADEKWQRVREDYWTFSRKDGLADKAAYIRFVANRRIRRVAWHPEAVYQEMLKADVGIIPVETLHSENVYAPCPSWKLKSENRLTMKMSIGLPVVATPIPAYEAIVEHGRNACFARTRGEWLDCLAELRDPHKRRQMGELARESVRTRYSTQTQADRMVSVLRSLAIRKRPSARIVRGMAC